MLHKDQRAPVYRGSSSQQGDTRNAICKIHYYGKAFDYYQPYNTHTKTDTSTGTGFVLDAFPRDEEDNIYIVTAYHVVEGATKLLVEFSQLSMHIEPVPARLVAYSKSKDVALLSLRVDDQTLAQKITTLRSGDSDVIFPTQPVMAAGFALANDYQVTKGTVSGRTTSRIQVDCAVNPGNSGGPLLDDDGRVLGVVVSKLVADDIQNVNFVTPIVETLRCLKRFREGETPLALPQLSFNASFVPGSQHMDGPAGAYVTQVHANSSLASLGLARKDTLCEIEGRPVDLFGKVHVEWWKVDPLEIDTLLERAADGDTMRVRYWSAAAREMREGEFTVQRSLNIFRNCDPDADRLRYSCRGSLVVQALLPNHEVLTNAYRSMLIQPQVRERSFLVITAIRPESPFVIMDTISYGDIITYVNGAAVRTIDDYVAEWEAWEESESSTMILQMLDGNIAVARRESITNAETVTRAETSLESLDVLA